MKYSTRQYLYSVLRQAGNELRYVGQKFGQLLVRTPLPKIMIICIAAMLLIALVPLVLTLFVALVMLKLLLALVLLAVRYSKGNPEKLHYVKSKWTQK